MHPFRRPLLILIVLTIISPALLPAYGEQTPAPLADTQSRFDTTRAGSPGLARRAATWWPANSSVLPDGIRELADEKKAPTHPSTRSEEGRAADECGNTSSTRWR